MKKPVARPPIGGKGRKAVAREPVPPAPAAERSSRNGEQPRPQNGEPGEEAIVGDGRLPSSRMRSYALLTPDLKELYFKFYKATYGKTKLDLKTKEFIAIAAALALNCKGCVEGHLKKAKREGATAEEISEVIAVTLGVAAAAIVDRSDIANFHLGGLFEKPE